jgi:dynein heavy chain
LLDVAKACLLLRGEKKNFAWPNFLKAIGNPQKFLDDLVTFDGKNIDQWILDQLKPILALDYFSYEVMKNKSVAASFLCKWIINVVIFNTIYKKVKPLMEMAEAAQTMSNEKMAELSIVLEKVRVITEKVNGLKAKLEEAEA